MVNTGYIRNDRGNIAMITALVALPLAIVVGISIDMSRANVTRNHITNSLDTAVLAAAAELADGADETSAVEFGKRIFAENLATIGVTSNCATPNLVPDSANGTISGTVDCDMPLTITTLLGREQLPIQPTASAAYGNDDIEVALMLDVSGSMRGQRLTDLKAAANQMIDTLIPVSGTGNIRMSLAPYSTAVNAGTYGDVTTGITNLYAHTVANLGADPNALVAAFTTSDTSADSFDLVDAVGAGGLGDLSSPFFACATPPLTISHTYPYVCEVRGGDGIGSDDCIQWSSSGQHIYSIPQSDFPIRTSTHISYYYNDGDEDGEPDCLSGCRFAPSASITDYTYVDVHGGAGSANCIDGTGSATQVATDWQALDWTSASEAYSNFDFSVLGATHEANIGSVSCVTERFGTNAFTDVSPISYPVGAEASTCPNAAVEPLTHNTTILKDAITSLEADGWTAGHLGIAWSWYTLSPNWNAVWPFNRRSEANDPMKNIRRYAVLMTDGSFNTYYANSQGDSAAQAQSLCTAMKTDGIEIFSVAFNAPSDARAVLQNCASSSTHYFAPTDGTELLAVYDAIAASLSQVRLTG